MKLPRPCGYCGRPYRKRCGCLQSIAAERASQAARSQRYQAKPASQAARQGYKAGYEAQRRELQLAIHNSRSAGRDVCCAICGLVIHTSEPWSAEHDPPLSAYPPGHWSGRLLPAHPRCNSARRNTRA